MALPLPPPFYATQDNIVKKNTHRFLAEHLDIFQVLLILLKSATRNKDQNKEVIFQVYTFF